ncbi:MAG: hypothetical protein Q9185_006571 [Variospora sp. 1 TL-2023]
MKTHGESRERSPAYQGAQLAFSSPAATSKSPNHIDNEGRGALAAANRVGIWTASDNVLLKDGYKGRDAAATQQQKNNASSYIAANLAAQLSTEQLPPFKGPPVPIIWSRPAPSRAHSDMTVRRNPKSPSINTLIKHYEKDSAGQMSLKTLQSSPQRRVSSLNAREPKIPQLSVSSLANAMVASSLASSRAPSPTNPSLPPPPPPRRRSRAHLFHRTQSADKDDGGLRTPSPSKGTMRQTMRAPLEPAENLAVKHSRNRFIYKHPNKHHEGDRKRWRDQITEFERKRYEGVWAANKGLLIQSYGNELSRDVDLGNAVLNIVVRDVWSRSKLSKDILEEVWNLVTINRDTGGLLSREEFVVGMWLVDQRLKGRKLPAKVSDSVWFSARGLTGIKVKRRH